MKILSQGARAKFDIEPAKNVSRLNNKYFIFLPTKRK